MSPEALSGVSWRHDHHRLVLAALQQVPPPEPRSSVPDPGVIATDQQVTPAGIQTVFQGRVAGVRFGSRGHELWVAVPGRAYRLDWRANRVLSVAEFDGSPGVHGVAVDPVTGRVLVSSVGRLPRRWPQQNAGGARARGRPGTAQLTAFDGSATRAAPPRRVVHLGTLLGSYMAGGPAVARRPNASGHRVAVVPLPADDKVAVVDADSGELLRLVDAGVLPVAAVVSDDGSEAWFTNFGGPKPTGRDRAARQCCDPMAEDVRVDPRGIAEAGTVSRLDPVTGRITATVEVGRHATGPGLGHGPGAALRGRRQRRRRDGGGHPRSARRVGTSQVRPLRRAEGRAWRPRPWRSPPTGGTLYVALGGANAVAVLRRVREGGAGALPGPHPHGRGIRRRWT